jgi:hypothetical protein
MKPLATGKAVGIFCRILLSFGHRHTSKIVHPPLTRLINAILFQGAKSADMPIGQATKFERVIDTEVAQ